MLAYVDVDVDVYVDVVGGQQPLLKEINSMNHSLIAKLQAARKNPKKFLEPIGGFTDSQRDDLKRVSKSLPSVLKIFQCCYNGSSKSNALKAKCLECSNLDKSHITSCSISRCPLWLYRPYQKK